jgi:hypothetical protein
MEIFKVCENFYFTILNIFRSGIKIFLILFIYKKHFIYICKNLIFPRFLGINFMSKNWVFLFIIIADSL